MTVTSTTTATTTEVLADTTAPRFTLGALSDALDGLAAEIGAGLTFAVAGADAVPVLYREELELRESLPMVFWPDFALGRHAAHLALERLGVGRRPISSHRGAPTADADVVVSISHSGGCAICAVAPRRSVELIGVDLQCGLLPVAAAHLVGDSFEQRWMTTDTGELSPLRLTTIWSAKEATFKATSSRIADDSSFLSLRHIRLAPSVSGFVARVPDRWQVNADHLLVRSVALGSDAVASVAVGTPQLPRASTTSPHQASTASRHQGALR